MISINGVNFGGGTAKICVPLTADSLIGLKEELAAVLAMGPEVIEWRADMCTDLWKSYRRAGEYNDEAEYGFIKAITYAVEELFEGVELPIIYTVRTGFEGGAIAITAEDYKKFQNRAIGILKRNPAFGLIDIEMSRKAADSLIAVAHSEGLKVIASYHDFEKTPPKEEIQDIFDLGKAVDGDIVKIAVMPKIPSDPGMLMNETKKATERIRRPVIAIAMGDLGKITRVTGHHYGSCLTFAAGVNASAPGQVSITALKKALGR